MVTGIEHLAIASPDPERLANWYVAHLNFLMNYHSGGAFFVKAPNGFMIEIIPSEGAGAPFALQTPGFRHLAIAVNYFDGVYEFLQSKGVKFLAQPLDAGGNRVVFFEDADGNILHLLQRAISLP